MSMKVTLFFLLTVAIVSYPTESRAKNETSIGEKIYREHCKVCHGDDGNGKTFVANVLNPPPKNFTNPLIIDSLTRKQMVFSVTNGRPGSGMMPWGPNLTKKEIEAVVGYIRVTFMGK